MAIHIAEAESPGGPWFSRGMLMASFGYEEFERSWIGAGGPPISLGNDRFLMIYHVGHFRHDGAREYDLAAALLDFSRRQVVVSRIEPVLRPQTDWEKTGDISVGVDNVVFSCANLRIGDEVVVPYAGADSRMLVSSTNFDQLVAALEKSF